MNWLQDRGWVVGIIVSAALAVAVLTLWSARRRSPAAPVPGAVARRRVDLTFAAAVLITLAVGVAAVLWLLAQAGQVPAGKDRATLTADAVKTGATIALGTGGAAYLLLAYRRQRLEELDTRERRITELFTKAVEELGHEKAPVRLGALYSLERLAQNNPEHRQTVVDVVCAYLRMPYTLPVRTEPDAEQVEAAPPPAHDGIPAAHPVLEQNPAQEELQVRQTGQRILAIHLQSPEGTSGTEAQRRHPSPRRAFWPGISLDLTGAALVDFNFTSVSIVQARFVGAIFQGSIDFIRATFHGDASLDGASFHGDASFEFASFHGDASFDAASFHGDASFNDASFQGTAGFGRASFQGTAVFGPASFQGTAGFDGATFRGPVWFSGATFKEDAQFGDATFQELAGFSGATFHGWAGFAGATFHGAAGFNEVSFRVPPEFGRTKVLDLNKQRVWPDGYTVLPDPADPTRGTLIRANQAEEPEPATPPLDRPADDGLGTG
jgi:hypothetical protein